MKNHIILILTSSFLLGIVLADRLTTSFSLPFALLGTSILFFVLIFFLLLLTFRTKNYFFSLLLIFFLFVGALRYISSSLPRENDTSKFASLTPQHVLLHGVVIKEPETRENFYAPRTRFTIRANSMLIKDTEKNVSGKVLVNLVAKYKGEFPKLNIGDKLIIGGSLSIPLETNKSKNGFDYKRYLNRMGIHAVMTSRQSNCLLVLEKGKGPRYLMRKILALGRNLSSIILHKHLTEKNAAIIESIILGLRTNIPREFQDALTKTGTVHILSVSGLHMGIVGIISLFLLRQIRCPKRLSYILTIITLYMFNIFTGSRVSSGRAALMGTFVLINMLLERDLYIMSSLALAAFITTFFWPGEIFAPGFILSYLAVFSILCLDPLITNILPHTKWKLLKASSVSLSAWIGMLPVIAYYYGLVTPSSMLANLLAIPVLFVILILGFVLLAVGSIGILTPIAFLISSILNFVILLFTKAIDIILLIPFSFVKVSPPYMAFTVMFYIGLLIFAIYSMKTNRTRPAFFILCLYTTNIFLWSEIACKFI